MNTTIQNLQTSMILPLKNYHFACHMSPHLGRIITVKQDEKIKKKAYVHGIQDMPWLWQAYLFSVL